MSTALIVVDVEVCFCEGGTLPVAGGAAVASDVTAFLAERGDQYSHVVATRDWHNPLPDTNEGHFAADGNPDYVTTWPEHGVAGTPDSDYHPDLVLPDRTIHVIKGMGRQDYSGFEGVVHGTDTPLVEALPGVERLDVVGIATDHCVKATVQAARAAGFDVRVLLDLTAGVSAETTAAAVAQMRDAGAAITTSEEIG